VAALASYPAGYLSDQWGRKNVLLFSFLIFLAVYAGFGFSTSAPFISWLFVLYGIFQGTFRAVGKALAIDFVSTELRASGGGWYTATVGLSGLVASVLGGQFWTRIGPSATFLYGAGFCVLGIIALQRLLPPSTEVPRAAKRATSMLGQSRSTMGPCQPPCSRTSVPPLDELFNLPAVERREIRRPS
jgi:MFS family permease